MRSLLGLIAALAAAAPAWAARPHDGALGFQPPATPVMQEIEGFHNHLLLVIISVITAFVLLLLLWVMVRYNARANPEPQKFSHNTLVEVIWTAVPILILLVIAVPSFRLLYNEDVIPDGKRAYLNGEVIPAPELTIKVTGRQWNWSYAYPDNGDFEYVSALMPKEQAGEEDYLLKTNAPMVAPEDTTVRLIVTAGDVIHDWAMPSFGLKVDAVPGRLNEAWFRVDEPGTYYGQCSELCGIDHAFMPIHVEIVSKRTFTQWVAAEQEGDYDGAARIIAEYKDGRADETRLAELH